MATPVLDLLRLALRLTALAALGLGLTHCSSDGGTVAPPTYGAINFVGSTITNNSMTLPCDTPETFTITQPGFSGTFSLVVDQIPTLSSVARSPKDTNTTLTLTPSSGTTATTFTVQTNYEAYTYTITATGGGGITGVLNIPTITVGNCG
jgi:hypothetical protein